MYDNNTENFAPKGNMVASVPTGTGLMVMASTNVELLNNEVRDHGTVNVIVTSYLSTGIKIKDPKYVPYPTKIHIHHNIFGPCGDKPSGTLGQFMAPAAGTPLPDIVWDGVIDASTGDVPVLSVHNNEKLGGEVTFASLGAAATLEDPSAAQVQRDVTVHSTPLPPVPAVKVEGTEVAAEEPIPKPANAAAPEVGQRMLGRSNLHRASGRMATTLVGRTCCFGACLILLMADRRPRVERVKRREPSAARRA